MPTLIDLFAGCGGLSEGFLSTPGFEGLAHVEWDQHALNVLRHRLQHHGAGPERTVHFDIQRLDDLFSGVRDDREYGNHQDWTRWSMVASLTL